MPDLTILAANCHNNRPAVAYLRRRSRADALEHYDVGLVSEAHRRTRTLRTFPGHDYRTGHHPGPSQETGILVGRNLTELGHASEFLSPAAPQFPSVGKERWGQWVAVEYGGTEIAFVVYHPVAGPDALHGKNPDHPLVKRYLAATQWLDATVAYHVTRGREVVVGADCQVGERLNRLWSPRHVFANHDMDWLWEGIDVLAWTSGLGVAGKEARRVVHDFPSDHPLLKVRLEVKPRRR